MSAHFIDEEGYQPPPAQTARNNAQEAYYVVIELHVGQQEVEAGKQAYYEEENQGVGHSEKKAAQDVFSRRPFS